MKVIIVFLFLTTAAYAVPVGPLEDSGHAFIKNVIAYITRYDSGSDGYGNYAYDIEQSDNQSRGEVGGLENQATEDEGNSVQGYYMYEHDGKEYAVSYTADKNGFRPTGEHLVPSAGVTRGRPTVGIPSSAIASLAGGGLG